MPIVYACVAAHSEAEGYKDLPLALEIDHRTCHSASAWHKN